MEFVTNGRNFYNYLMNDVADPRVKNWFLMDSLLPVLIIPIVYGYLVLSVGPKLMSNRKPFNIDKILIAYNAMQVVMNACMFLIGLYLTEGKLNLCNNIDYSENTSAVLTARLQWFYFITKIIDFFDTLFFILRKKESQVTFLHVYHHSTMILGSWLFAKFAAGGQTLYFTLLNTFVHVCMYTYYMLTAWKKEYKDNVWWKKHITELQLIQFLIGAFLQYTAITAENCQYPTKMFVFTIPQNIVFLSLFTNFYIKSYIFPKKQTAKTK